MKKWTVMLIPHDRGSSRTLYLSAYQVWIVVALLVVLSFTTGFFFKRHQAFTREVNRLQQAKRALEAQRAKQAPSAATPVFSAQERIELEQRIRAEYEARDAAITAKLSDLKELEDRAREMTGIAPKATAKNIGFAALGKGKGGGGRSLGDVAYAEENGPISSPSVIYGMSQPSADLIIQEINLRTASLQQLVTDLAVKQEAIARMPSIWPVASRASAISSPYGFRKDPYGLRISHHDGSDIMGPYAAPILATGKGVVAYSGFDPGGLGNLVRIDHGNGVETWYGHLERRAVQEGEAVDRKRVIGRLGTTGKSTGPHLHYEVHVNGRPVDPAKYLKD